MTTSETGFRVDPSNTEQRRAWDGEEGAYWAAHSEHFDAGVRLFHPVFLEAAAIKDGDSVLDVGCGTGESTLAAARLTGSGSTLGVDLSARMLEVARRRATEEGISNAAFLQADAQVHPFAAAAFDGVISRTGAMFFGAPIDAFANLARATRPGGRLTLLVWQDLLRNEWVREFFSALAAGRDLPQPPADAPGPFSMADPERTRDLLTRAGWSTPDFTPVELPMYFGRSADDGYDFILGLLAWMLEGLDHEGRTRAQDALRASFQSHETADGVLYDAAAWLITAVRR